MTRAMLIQIAAVFGTVFVAELGDKTQLAALFLSAEGRLPPVTVFAAASAALVASTAVAVLLGSLAGRFLEEWPLELIAGLAFIGLGLWMVLGHFRGGA
jgi:putative Ca2+/H+ antiporter (TMEM165/GDT1 family)